jgi:hypothetical protein
MVILVVIWNSRKVLSVYSTRMSKLGFFVEQVGLNLHINYNGYSGGYLEQTESTLCVYMEQLGKLIFLEGRLSVRVHIV